MHLGFRVTSKQLDRQSVGVDCPRCGARRVRMEAEDLHQRVLVAYVVPIFVHSLTLVRCSCGASLMSRLKARDLVGIGPHYAARFLSVRVSPVLKTLA